MGLFENIFIFPAMGDEGLSVGAALVSHYRNNHLLNTNKVNSVIQNIYYGGEFTDNEIKKELIAYGLDYEYFIQDIETTIAKLLASGKIVARFNGRMEYGPRALGNRSILGATFDPEINNWLNKKLKRTEFMPFAPSILEEEASNYFEGYRPDHIAADYMTITYKVKQDKKNKIPAVVHVDGTARPQIVRKDINKSFYTIIKEFGKITNVPVLLNTSFNVHEEPIVYTPKDAIRGFLDTELDFLAIGNFLVPYPNKQ